MNMKKVITLAMSLLLIGSNVAFSQVKKPSNTHLTNNVKRAAASAKRKGPTSQQLMKEIKEAITGTKLSRYKKEIVTSAGALPGGVLTAAGVYIGSAAPVEAAAGIVVGGVLIAIGTGVASLGYEASHYIPARDMTEQYADIKCALNSEFLGHFPVYLADPDNMTERTRRMLVAFLSHPYKDYGAQKINGTVYRFFFDPLNSQVWADIDVGMQALFVRNSSIIAKGKHVVGHLVQGYYAGKPIKKGEKY